MANEMSFTFLNGVGALSLKPKIKIRIARIVKEHGCVDMLFDEEGENGLLAMLLFNKELSTMISKATYHLFGKLPKSGNNIYPAQLEYLVFENSRFELNFETNNNTNGNNFNVYKVTEMTHDNIPVSKLKNANSTVEGDYSSVDGNNCSIGTGYVENYANKAGVDSKNNLEVPYAGKDGDVGVII